jgi:hypothetical protein
LAGGVGGRGAALVAGSAGRSARAGGASFLLPHAETTPAVRTIEIKTRMFTFSVTTNRGRMQQNRP